MEVTVPLSRTVASPSLKSVILKNSRKVVNESEVLLRGQVNGASVRKVN